MTGSGGPQNLGRVDLAAPWRVGVDIGGTFTDLVLVDALGTLHFAKVPSTPSAPVEGAVNAIRTLGVQIGWDTSALLQGCAQFVHGSTVATNAVLEGKGARVGLLTTRGLRDSLEIRRGLRPHQWDHRRPHPPILVPRFLRRPVSGRLDHAGREILPLDIGDVDAALAAFRVASVEAIAICLINSFANPEHELSCAERARAFWPNEWIYCSHRIAPVVGEYERSSTVVLNAMVAPKVETYLKQLSAQLHAMGLRGELLLAQSNGGLCGPERLKHSPINLVLSGPSAVVGALRSFGTVDQGDIITMEIGGTSCDIAIARRGRVAMATAIAVSGYDIAIPAVDIHTIGAGGGTIAGVDRAGLLFVGPQGSGAIPGPAAYGRGGIEPTVTDALITLGRLRPRPLGDGQVKLDAGLASEAVRAKIAGPLGIDVVTAAAGVIRLLERQIVQAIESITLRRGIDPRDFTLLAAGGAGPMHAASVARALGCPRVLIPRLAGAFCAAGLLNADVRVDRRMPFKGDLQDSFLGSLSQALNRLKQDARSELAQDGVVPSSVEILCSASLRYQGQHDSIGIPLSGAPSAVALRNAFEAEHERLFGHKQPNAPIEITAVSLVASSRASGTVTIASAPLRVGARTLARQQVFLGEKEGWAEIDVLSGDALGAADEVRGPALIETATTTLFVGPNDTLRVNEAGHFVLDLNANARSVTACAAHAL
jgi:N-methylhydantoinase A